MLGRLTRPILRGAASMSHGFYTLVLWLTRGWLRRIALVVVMIGVAMAGSLGADPAAHLPAAGQPELIFAIVLTPPGYSVEEYRQMALHAEKTLRPGGRPSPGRRSWPKLQRTGCNVGDTMMVPAWSSSSRHEGRDEAGGFPAAAGSCSSSSTLRHSPAPAGDRELLLRIYDRQRVHGRHQHRPGERGVAGVLFQQALQGIPGAMAFAQQASIFQLGDSFGSAVGGQLLGRTTTRSAPPPRPQGAVFMTLNTFPLPNPQNFAIGREETRVMPDRPRAASAGLATPASAAPCRSRSTAR
jgi:hypothetical protein